jgi:hypothetical protein
MHSLVTVLMKDKIYSLEPPGVAYIL